MIKQVIRDIFFLSQKSTPATKDDLPIAQDLQDTLTANRDRCVGMAANMIGVNKRIIIVNNGSFNIVMFNPVIIQKSGPYVTEEGCLSLSGVRRATRYERITLDYRDISWKHQRLDYTGWIAQIIQHECDHLEGIII